MTKSKKEIKIEQAGAQSDMQDWTIDNSFTLSDDIDITFGQGDFGFDEADLRQKYPALKDAHDHYQNILDINHSLIYFHDLKDFFYFFYFLYQNHKKQQFFLMKFFLI